MNVLIALLLIYLMVWAIRTLTNWACPPAGRLIDATARTLTNLFWKLPMRRLGLGMTLLALLLLFTVLSTVAALIAPTASSVSTALFFWSLVYAIWWFLRWRAERRFAPRPLPQRERGREP